MEISVHSCGLVVNTLPILGNESPFAVALFIPTASKRFRQRERDQLPFGPVDDGEFIGVANGCEHAEFRPERGDFGADANLSIQFVGGGRAGIFSDLLLVITDKADIQTGTQALAEAPFRGEYLAGIGVRVLLFMTEFVAVEQ